MGRYKKGETTPLSKQEVEWLHDVRAGLYDEEPPAPVQPEKCRGCIWGHWDGLVQTCSRVVCVKENEA